MITYMMLSIFLGILGAAVVAGYCMIAVLAYRRRKALERKRAGFSGEEELERYIAQVDQATRADELDDLDNTRKHKGDD